MNKFAKISSINPDEVSTFNDKVFLTFDVDWAADTIIEYTLKILDDYDVPSTWFITHESPVLQHLRSDERIELGIHPNFNLLMQESKIELDSSMKIISNMMSIVPEATAVRSHSLTTGSKLKSEFKQVGLTHHCNSFVPFTSGNLSFPYHEQCGLIEVPHSWEDDVHSHLSNESTISDLAQGKYCVFDFHPVHIFLNSFGNETYEATRNIQQEKNAAELLKSYRQDTYGTYDVLMTILNDLHLPVIE